MCVRMRAVQSRAGPIYVNVRNAKDCMRKRTYYACNIWILHISDLWSKVQSLNACTACHVGMCAQLVQFMQFSYTKLRVVS